MAPPLPNGPLQRHLETLREMGFLCVEPPGAQAHEARARVAAAAFSAGRLPPPTVPQVEHSGSLATPAAAPAATPAPEAAPAAPSRKPLLSPQRTGWEGLDIPPAGTPEKVPAKVLAPALHPATHPPTPAAAPPYPSPPAAAKRTPVGEAGELGVVANGPVTANPEWPRNLFTAPRRPPYALVLHPLGEPLPAQPAPPPSAVVAAAPPEPEPEPPPVPPRKAAATAPAPAAEELDLFGAMEEEPAAPPPPPPPKPAAKAPAVIAPAAPAAGIALVPAPAEALLPSPEQREERVARLSEIAIETARCAHCRLNAGRTHIVPGQGNPCAPLVFVGEGPGQNEDEQGLAFVGRAGQLLTELIHSISLTRDDVFICNVVKCRPPGNRVPADDEMISCEPYLKRQLDILRPQAIVALGATAAKCLLRNPKLSITRVHGQWTRYEGIPLLPVYHPAYVLRNQPETKALHADFLVLAKVFGLEPRAPETGTTLASMLRT